MSYILDALRKSDQERKKGEVPDLNTIQGLPGSPDRSVRYLWPYLLSGALLLSVLFLILWLLLRQPETNPAPQVTASGQAAKEEITPPAAEEDPPLQPTENQTEQATVSVETGNTAATPEEQPVDEVNTEAAPAPGIEIINETMEAERDLAVEEPGNAAEESSPETPKVVSYSKLPVSVTSKLPEITIAAHYYATTPTSRMASINGRIMRQGQEISQGLILEEITPTGVVISSGKYHFSMEVFSR